MADVSTERVLALCGMGHRNPHDAEIDLAAAEAAKFLLFLINERSEKSEPLDTKLLSGDLINFIRSRNPKPPERDVPSILDAMQKHIVCQTAGIEDESLKSFQVLASTRLLEDIKARYKSPNSLPAEETTGMTISDNDFSVANGSRVNSLALDYWRDFQEFRLDSGIFTAGPTSTATVYARAASNILSHEIGPLSFNVDGALAAFSVLPPESDYFSQRTIVAGLASANLFAGFGHDFFSWLGVRAGLQATPAGYTGWNLPFDYLPPFTAGASLVWRPSDDVTLAAGSDVQFEPYSRNVQGQVILYPNLAGLAPFVYVNSPHFFADASFLFSGTGTEVQGEAGVPFSIGSQGFRMSVQGNGTLEGMPVYPASLFLNLSYIPDIGEDHGLIASATIVTAGRSDFSPESSATDHRMFRRLDELPRQIEEAERRRDLLEGPEGRLVDCESHQVREGNSLFYAYTCGGGGIAPGLEDLGNCERTSDPDHPGIYTYMCNSSIDNGDGALTPEEAVNLQTVIVEIRTERRGRIFSAVRDADVQIRDPFMEALHNSTSFSDFAARLKDSGASSRERLTWLHYISKKLYETYDEKGLNTLSGNGDVNSIGLEGMFRALQNRVFDPDSNENTTVCRGLAKFPTALAHEWGWESLTVSFSTPSSGHVVSVVKPPDMDNYQVIDRGDVEYNGALTILQTLENYTAAYRTEDGSPLPPQLSYELFDHTGKYIRTIFTSLGNELFSRTVVPDRLKGHLRGEKK